MNFFFLSCFVCGFFRLRYVSRVVVVSFQEIVADTVLFIADYRVNIDIFHTAENIALDKRIHLFQIFDQFFDLYALGAVFFIVTGCTRICEFAGTLDKMQTIVISPCPQSGCCEALASSSVPAHRRAFPSGSSR